MPQGSCQSHDCWLLTFIWSISLWNVWLGPVNSILNLPWSLSTCFWNMTFDFVRVTNRKQKVACQVVNSIQENLTITPKYSHVPCLGHHTIYFFRIFFGTSSRLLVVPREMSYSFQTQNGQLREEESQKRRWINTSVSLADPRQVSFHRETFHLFVWQRLYLACCLSYGCWH